jgi:uncharacterized membrane protein
VHRTALARSGVGQAVGLLILFPLALVSSCFVPTNGIPGLARTDRGLEPGSAVASPCRKLFGNPNPAGLVHSFPNQHRVLVSILSIAAILAVCVPLAGRMLNARHRRLIAPTAGFDAGSRRDRTPSR